MDGIVVVGNGKWGRYGVGWVVLVTVDVVLYPGFWVCDGDVEWEGTFCRGGRHGWLGSCIELVIGLYLVLL